MIIKSKINSLIQTKIKDKKENFNVVRKRKPNTYQDKVDFKKNKQCEYLPPRLPPKP